MPIPFREVLKELPFILMPLLDLKHYNTLVPDRTIVQGSQRSPCVKIIHVHLVGFQFRQNLV